MSALLELAERCEAATAEKQRALIIEAFTAINDGKALSPDVCARFGSLMNGGGYVDAALTLVPHGWDFIRLERQRTWPHDKRGDCIVFEVILMQLRGKGHAQTTALTEALAICAAALRATAAEQNNG